ncbi:MAG TPA: hypothetical protein ENN30_00010, partial [Candidatus Woesearchaeota archaeon]|nr:hypothetical protein [Candidatus Woesearchaeota archaeon]
METDPKYYFKITENMAFKTIFDVDSVFDILKKKDEFLSEFCKENSVIDPTSEIKEHCVIEAPCWIGENCVIGPHAYIRKGTVIGKDCRIRGEVKNSIILDGTKMPHYSYIGDSIIGSGVNFAVGSTATNFKFDGSDIKISDVNLGRKFGAVIGDNTKIGANVTISPGTFIGRDCWVYPLT